MLVYKGGRSNASFSREEETVNACIRFSRQDYPWQKSIQKWCDQTPFTYESSLALERSHALHGVIDDLKDPYNGFAPAVLAIVEMTHQTGTDTTRSAVSVECYLLLPNQSRYPSIQSINHVHKIAYQTMNRFYTENIVPIPKHYRSSRTPVVPIKAFFQCAISESICSQ